MADLADGLDRLFGLEFSIHDWKNFFGLECSSVEEWQHTVAPRFTFGNLASFLAARIEAVP